MKPAESFDRRVFGRRQTNISAQVRIGYRIVPCTIKDISEGGALLEFAEALDLPARLWLSWPEQPSEIVCEVRHARRNTAGVQFSRQQSLTLRPAVAPAEPVAATPALPPKQIERAAGTTGADLVAMRRGMRQTLAEPSYTSTAASTTGTAVAGESNPPRDLSTLMQSLKAAADAIVIARAAQTVPRPLAARHYSGSPVVPPADTPVVKAVRPMAATAFFGAVIEPSPSAIALVTIRPLPARAYRTAAGAAVVPLAASFYAGLPVEPPSLLPSPRAPAPLPAAGYAPQIAVLAACETHPCALSVWRSLAIQPPRPLPAWIYRFAAPPTVA